MCMTRAQPDAARSCRSPASASGQPARACAWRGDLRLKERFPPQFHIRQTMICRYLAVSTLLVASWATQAQFAPVPASVTATPWARDYKSCTDRAILGHATQQRDAHPLSPQDAVALTEQDCAGRLPLAGMDSSANQEVQHFRASVHRDLLSRFGNPTTITTVSTVPPPRPSTNIEVKPGVSCPRPEYPPAAIRTMAQGTTRVTLSVNESGEVIDGTIDQASGESREHRLLDRAVADSFRGCKFAPALGGGMRKVTLSYAWRLD